MNNSIVFTFELAQRFYASTEEFPVDFELAWQWLGYTKKGNAKRALVKNFVENEDYRVLKLAKPVPQGGFVYPEEIWITVNCLKEMGMMAGTLKGKEVRRYFLKCEAIAKCAIQDMSRIQNQVKQLCDEVVDLKHKLSQRQSQSVSPSHETVEILGEMARVVESYIAGSRSLNAAIHTTIHQQSESLRLAFENLRRLHDKTLTIPAVSTTQPALPQSLIDDIGNLLKLTPRLTNWERRQVIINFLDLIDELPLDDERRSWSSRQIGAFLGVSYRTVCHILAERRGERKPPEYPHKKQ